MMHRMLTSLQKKSDDIMVEATKVETYTTNEIDDHHISLDVKIDQLQINNTAELWNHTKHISSQHETHMNNTKITIDDLRDDVHIVQAGSSKILQHTHQKLSKPDKVGSMNY